MLIDISFTLMNKMRMKQQGCTPDLYSFISKARELVKYNQNIIFECHNTKSLIFVLCTM